MIQEREAAGELEPLEGDEGEPDVGRDRHVGRELLRTPLAEVKRGEPVTVAPDATVAEGIALMRERRVSALLVVANDDGRRLAGIFTERDLLERALPVPGYAGAPIAQFMTRDPETLHPSDPVAYAVNKMSVGRFRHVPLVDGEGRPAGMFSIRDLADFVVELCAEEVLNLPPEPELAMHPRPEGE
ncbi:cyclic nucleotide-binding/CBS domain-containing protein [Anaeromyxobacter sp. Fw109-5]|uniref:CBS domain-containing protein n=1 Tax=Anaeromyxobacter sp. (strain Fw109-5) TaxID=404589 RepID=UPI000158A4D9|nr:CBS domain-containing protein [Anaeromyxobacter sp. Fw109-5]ABS24994.1 CBS domain containing protein [Anaeromyxobacter sp. Fw109-5]